MEAEKKKMEQELVPHPYSAPTPIPVHAVYMHSGIYPEAKRRGAGGRAWLLSQETEQTTSVGLSLKASSQPIHPNIIPASQKQCPKVSSEIPAGGLWHRQDQGK